MKLLSFHIKNYRSIEDSDVVGLSELDNILVLAGQNESGKSSLLKALLDYENGKFDADSLPFSMTEGMIQSVSCVYRIEKDDNFVQMLEDEVKDKYSLQISEGEKVLNKAIIDKITKFELTLTKEGDNIKRTIDDTSFNIFSAAILDKPPIENQPQGKYVEITDDKNSEIAGIFWTNAPKIVLFEDFCDLLPDRILIADLKSKKTEAKGYRAVKNLEKILGVDFISKNEEKDAVRRTKEKKDNEQLSINFQNDWGQRIHGENQVLINYNFEKRDGEGEAGSYVNFYVQTKNDQPLPPRQRSKGLIWFLSLWLELQAQSNGINDLVLLLDEPDQHLHVKAQKDVLKLINRLANRDKDQIIYATHSPYLIEVEYLSRIRLVLNMEKEGTKVEDITTSKIDTTYKKDALKPIADAIGINVSEFSPLKDKNVLLEGISDFNYFTGMKKLLKIDGDYHFVPGIGVRQINNLISLCIGYGMSWVAIIDDDPDEGGKDSEKKFNEIRDALFDGNEVKTKERVFILDKVVGIENMFTLDDFKLIDSKLGKSRDMVKVVGQNRKVLFSKLFKEKVDKGLIKDKNLSKKSKDNFSKAFSFIKTSL